MVIKTYKEYKQIIDDCPIKWCQIYQDYKGEYYQIVGISLDPNTLEPRILYRGKACMEWDLPLSEFLTPVKDKDGVEIPRFVLVNPVEGV